MWSTNTIWFDVSVYVVVLLVGNILMGHFEERTSRYRRLTKTTILVIVMTSITVFFGRTIGFTVLGLTFIPVLYVHGIALPKKGINGWTGEPKSKYYQFRGWSQDIFKSQD